MATWTAHLIETVTGRLGAKLEVTSGSWEDPLNDIPSTTLTIAKSEQMGQIGSRWWTPWMCGAVLCWDDVPLLAGPLTEPVKETRTTLSLTVKGIEALLARWVVLDRNFDSGDALRNGPAVAYTGLSLGSIAWQLVAQGMGRNGSLPIVHGSPDEQTGHQRTYEAWNLANNSLWKRLSEITAVIGGPDLAFRPEWADDAHRYVRWRMMHGTEAQPQIAQDRTPVIDDTTQGRPDVAMEPASEWDATNHLYATGAGEEAGMLVSQSVAERPTLMPVLEDVMSDSSTESWDLVQAHCDAGLATRQQWLTQIPLTVACESPQARLTDWHTGDAVQVTLGTDWWTLAAGTGRMRCVKRSGQIGAATYTVDLQED